MIVVPVFMTSCQVSEYLNIGPVIPQITTTAKAIPKADELPVQQVIFEAARSNMSFLLFVIAICSDDLILSILWEILFSLIVFNLAFRLRFGAFVH